LPRDSKRLADKANYNVFCMVSFLVWLKQEDSAKK